MSLSTLYTVYNFIFNHVVVLLFNRISNNQYVHTYLFNICQNLTKKPEHTYIYTHTFLYIFSVEDK